MTKKIELEFNKTISRLAGNSFGKEVYDKQVKDKVDFDDENIIVFPSYIEDVAISFVQGFTSEIFEKIDKNSFFEHFIIDANDKMAKNFRESIYF